MDSGDLFVASFGSARSRNTLLCFMQVPWWNSRSRHPGGDWLRKRSIHGSGRHPIGHFPRRINIDGVHDHIWTLKGYLQSTDLETSLFPRRQFRMAALFRASSGYIRYLSSPLSRCNCYMDVVVSMNIQSEAFSSLNISCH